jgi:ribosome-binding ATPase YchF (GTP1/OBG family)
MTSTTSPASARVQAKGPDLFSGVRTCDALLAVVRAFANPAVPAPGGVDAARDLRALENELIYNDLAIVETRRERIAKEMKIVQDGIIVITFKRSVMVYKRGFEPKIARPLAP